MLKLGVIARNDRI